jgi:hypothetical protein
LFRSNNVTGGIQFADGSGLSSANSITGGLTAFGMVNFPQGLTVGTGGIQFGDGSGLSSANNITGGLTAFGMVNFPQGLTVGVGGIQFADGTSLTTETQIAFKNESNTFTQDNVFSGNNFIVDGRGLGQMVKTSLLDLIRIKSLFSVILKMLLTPQNLPLMTTINLSQCLLI